MITYSIPSGRDLQPFSNTVLRVYVPFWNSKHVAYPHPYYSFSGNDACGSGRNVYCHVLKSCCEQQLEHHCLNTHKYNNLTAVFDYRQSLAHVGMTIITIFGAIVIIVIIISLMVTCCRTLSARRTHHVRKYRQSLFFIKVRPSCVNKTELFL